MWGCIHTLSLNAKHVFTVHVPQNQKYVKTLPRSAISLHRITEEFQPLLLPRRHSSKTTSVSVLFGCVVKHVWEYRTSPIYLYIWPKPLIDWISNKVYSAAPIGYVNEQILNLWPRMCVWLKKIKIKQHCKPKSLMSLIRIFLSNVRKKIPFAFHQRVR